MTVTNLFYQLHNHGSSDYANFLIIKVKCFNWEWIKNFVSVAGIACYALFWPITFICTKAFCLVVVSTKFIFHWPDISPNHLCSKPVPPNYFSFILIFLLQSLLNHTPFSLSIQHEYELKCLIFPF